MNSYRQGRKLMSVKRRVRRAPLIHPAGLDGIRRESSVYRPLLPHAKPAVRCASKAPFPHPASRFIDVHAAAYFGRKGSGITSRFWPEKCLNILVISNVCSFCTVTHYND